MHLTNSAVNKLNVTGCVHAGICQPMKWSLSGLKYVLVDLIFLPLEIFVEDIVAHGCIPLAS